MKSTCTLTEFSSGSGISDEVSGRQAHILQARHNEALAKELVQDGYRFKDWSIITAFYAAVHYFEARLHDEPQLIHPEAVDRILHTEESTPRVGGRYRYSPHAWREELFLANCDDGTQYAYRVLRTASETARYHSRAVIVRTAHDHFTDGFVNQCVMVHLGQVKSGLGVS